MFTIIKSCFMRALREASGTPVGLSAGKWMLEVGALFMRTETELVLKSRRVVPRRLLDHGFVFKYPLWPDAAGDLCRQWELARQRGSKAARCRPDSVVR
jgi:NAD dependent epimerase/dehydratase family enzyme